MRRGALLILLMMLAQPAAAQPTPSIEAAEREALDADARARALRRDADAADTRMRNARFTAITLARRIQGHEAHATRIEARLATLEQQRRRERARLAEKHGEVSRLIAALQTLSRRPAGLVLLEPRGAVETARVSALLAAVRPELAARTAALRAELAVSRRSHERLADTRRQLERARAALSASIASLGAVQKEQRAERDRLDAEADAERERARRLASRAIDLRGLARAVERDQRRRTPAAADPERQANRSPDGFSYRLPAAGSLRLGFGRRDSAGVRARGLTLATRDNAQVTAPAKGRVAYAGPFREYGDIVIVQHDGDMLSLISGMERVDVVVGEAVRTGTPIGRMGAGRPELYLELRARGTPVDPATYLQRRG